MADKQTRFTLRRLLSLYALYARMDWAWLMRDSKIALTAIFSDLLWAATSVAGLYLLSVRFGSIGGFTQHELLFMMAYFSCVRGLHMVMVGGNNISHISRIIGRGQLEHYRIQPVPMPLHWLAEGFMPFTGSSNLLGGIGLMIVALHRLEIAITPGFLALMVGEMLVSLVLLVALTYLASAAAFYAPVAAEEISTLVVDTLFGQLATLPLGTLDGGVRVFLMSLLPVGYMAWFPTAKLVAHNTMGFPQAISLFAAVAAALLATIIFRKGLKVYAHTGTKRYRSMGFRN